MRNPAGRSTVAVPQLRVHPEARPHAVACDESLHGEQNWIWVVAADLDGYDGAAIRDMGHLRWKIENNAFGELTQHWHLTHCAHHHPVAVLALLWIKIIAFTLFHAFAILHGKLFRLGKTTLQELRKQIYRSLLCGSPIPFFSG